MNSKNRFFMALFAGLIFWQGAAAAEMVQGQVTAVNPGDRSLTVERMAEDGGQAKQIDLKVPESAELRGIQTFEEVAVGDEIRAEANKPALGIGNWEARWIERSGANPGSFGADRANSDARNRQDIPQGKAKSLNPEPTSGMEGSRANSAGSSSAANY